MPATAASPASRRACSTWSPTRRATRVVLLLAIALSRTSHAEPAATCTALCRRLSDCEISSKTCMDGCKKQGLEATARGRATILGLTRSSCSVIQSKFGEPGRDDDDDDFDADQGETRPPARAQADGNPSPRRGWLGLQLQEPESGAGSQGVMVIDILPGSPAASAGLRVGDRIGAVNGRPVGTRLEWGRWVSPLPPGTALRFSVRRGNRVREVAVTLGEPPPPGSLPTNGARARPAAPAPVRSSGSSGSGKWSCRAVGSYAPPRSSGGPDYSNTLNEDVTQYGETRDAAGKAAIDACAGLLRIDANPILRPGSLVLDYCKVIRCSR
jgi:hypothetical protein